MAESWADIVRGYSGGRAWADIVESDDASSSDLSEESIPIECGDPVGIREIQSILMSATQMNLSHFHTAGMNAIGVSAPTAAEALNSSYVNAGMTFETELDVYSLRKEIVGANLKSFVLTVGGSFTVLPDHENAWYEVLGLEVPDDVLLRFYINYMKMRDHGLTLSDLAKSAFGNDATTHVSPDFMGMIDVVVTNNHFAQWLSRMGNKVCGTFKVKSCEKLDRRKAITRGSDLMSLSQVYGINKRTITSNNVPEVETHFGIEAAAAVLRGLTGSSVVSDFMARTGRIMPFTKNSTEVHNKGLLSSMGFERPKEDIKRAMTTPDDSSEFLDSSFSSVYESVIAGTEPSSMFTLKI